MWLQRTLHLSSSTAILVTKKKISKDVACRYTERNCRIIKCNHTENIKPPIITVQGMAGSKRVVCFLQQHNTHCGINALQQAGSVLCNKLTPGSNWKGNVLFCWWNSAFQPDCGLSLKRIKTAALKWDYLGQKLRSAVTSPPSAPPSSFFPLRTCRHW